MYPRRTPKQQQRIQHKNTQIKEKQREVLRKLMQEQLSKKYSDQDKKIIQKEVNEALKKKNLTQDMLIKLENNIKTQGQEQHKNFDSQNKENIQKANDEIISVKSGLSKMSGASNFEKVELPKEDFTKNSNKKSAINTKLELYQPKETINDLGFLEEENEWAAIMKYNNFLFRKEDQMKKIKENAIREKFKSDLSKQIIEKENRKKMLKKEEDAYFENVKLQLKREDEKKNKQLQEARAKILYEKETRDKQMKEIKARRKFENQQQKALDSYLIMKLKEELEAEQQFIQAKKVHQFKAMERMKEQNEQNKRRIIEEQEQERQENIKLQEAYSRLIEEQNKEKEENIRRREEKIREFSKQAQDLASKNHWEKLNQMELRTKKYEDRLEKKRDLTEEYNLQRKKDQKLENRDFLQKQMAEKQNRVMEEKMRINQQAEMWKTDAQQYEKYESNKTNEKRKAMQDYIIQLKAQMADRIQEKRRQGEKMTEQELMLNRRMIEEIENYRSIIMDQIKREQTTNVEQVRQ